MAQSAPDYDVDLEFYLYQGPVVMRERGTTAGVISQLESGGPAEGGNLDASGAYIHPFTDQQLGTGRCLRGEIERVRWLGSAWHACSEATRGLLLLRHMAPPAEFRSDAGYGARDRWVDGSDHREGQHRTKRTGVDAELGIALGSDKFGLNFGLAAVAIKLCPDPGKLLVAVHEPNPLHKGGKRAGAINREESDRRRRIIRDALRRAEEALAPAWAEWFESKTNTDPMRLDTDRNPEWRPAPKGEDYFDKDSTASTREILIQLSRLARAERRSAEVAE